LKDNSNFVNAKRNTKYIIESCSCEDRFGIFGIRAGEQIEIKGECLFGGTVIVRHNHSEFCVRRSEIDAILKEVKE